MNIKILRGLFVFLLLLVFGSLTSPAHAEDTSTESLISGLAVGKPMALQYVRRLADRNIDRALSARELAVLKDQVTNGDSREAASAALVLSRCQQNPTPERLPVITTRFVQEINHPHLSNAPGYIISISDQASIYLCFVRAFQFLDDPTVAAALKVELMTTKSPEPRKWLQIALGYIGKGVDRAALLNIARGDKDNSLRYCAIQAYAHTARFEAVPFLETFANDMTITGYGCTRPIYGLRGIAQDELYRLRNPKH